MNNMTGFNPEQAKSDIANFYAYGLTTKMELVHAFEGLFSDLKDEWASQKAVEFDTKHRSPINAAIGFYGNTIRKICQNACHAYDEIATQQGLPGCVYTSTFDEAKDDIFDYDFPVIYHHKDGVVGMNIEEVNSTIEVFEGKITAFTEHVDELPMNIAFYDPNGSQSEAYKSLIEKSKTKVLEEVESIKADIKEAISTEENNILLAKQQAAEILSQ